MRLIQMQMIKTEGKPQIKLKFRHQTVVSPKITRYCSQTVRVGCRHNGARFCQARVATAVFVCPYNSQQQTKTFDSHRFVVLAFLALNARINNCLDKFVVRLLVLLPCCRLPVAGCCLLPPSHDLCMCQCVHTHMCMHVWAALARELFTRCSQHAAAAAAPP